MKPINTAMSAVPPFNGGNQEWLTVVALMVSVFAILWTLYKPARF